MQDGRRLEVRHFSFAALILAACPHALSPFLPARACPPRSQEPMFDNKIDPCGIVHVTVGDGGNREGLARR